MKNETRKWRDLFNLYCYYLKRDNEHTLLDIVMYLIIIDTT
jgi:hypothetical protein